MEHLEHFGLSTDPFSNEPDLSFFYESPVHLDAQRRLARSAKQGKGLTILSGAHGSGKTLLTRRLFEDLDEEKYEAVLMVVLPGASDASTLLRRLARELGASPQGEDRTHIVSGIYQALVEIREEGRSLVLMIDDAQILGNEVMAELGGLLNMEHEGRRLLSMLWVGSSELETSVAEDPALLSRVDVHVHLKNLGLEATKAYVDHRVKKASGSDELFAGPALDSLFKLSEGRPRAINTLADNALFEAYLCGISEVTAGEVERAGLDLGLLPAPSSDTAPFEVGPEPAAALEVPVTLPLDEEPRSIGKVDLVEGLSAESTEEGGAEAVLGLEDDDLWSPEEEVLSEEPGPTAWNAQASDGQTLDLEVEWRPDASPEGSGEAVLFEASAEDDLEVEIADAEPAWSQEAQKGARDASSIPARAEDAFLDLLED
ncbi:MAG: AAA family ATPase [Myxococcota bacterium]|nr:AAA family ATPase [Myxococcota bacterium]